jgi:hypothetical protein
MIVFGAVSPHPVDDVRALDGAAAVMWQTVRRWIENAPRMIGLQHFHCCKPLLATFAWLRRSSV